MELAINLLTAMFNLGFLVIVAMFYLAFAAMDTVFLNAISTKLAELKLFVQLLLSLDSDHFSSDLPLFFLHSTILTSHSLYMICGLDCGQLALGSKMLPTKRSGNKYCLFVLKMHSLN